MESYKYIKNLNIKYIIICIFIIFGAIKIIHTSNHTICPKWIISICIYTCFISWCLGVISTKRVSSKRGIFFCFFYITTKFFDIWFIASLVNFSLSGFWEFLLVISPHKSACAKSLSYNKIIRSTIIRVKDYFLLNYNKEPVML